MTSSDTVDGALCFLPLGGTEEIGMNLYLYGADDQWLMVDCGISFGDETTPGIEILMPDPAFIEARRDKLVGLVLTHAHEDHFGAIQYLWPRLRCPIYATPFTAAFLRLKLEETEFAKQVQIIVVPLSGTVQIGGFGVEFVSMTHSIPEPNALVIRTRHGTVVHSGDWKLDPRPVIGQATDIDRLRRLGEEGVTALVCDSTNVFEPGHSGSEAAVRDALTEVIRDQPQRVAVTCFATNVARLRSIAQAAAASHRQCALIGRSLWRVHEAARATGYLKGLPEPFVSEHDAGFIPRDKLVLVVTGSQGEPRSALTRIAFDDHPRIVLEPGDTVVFSAREIPGNEKAIARVQNALVRQGIRLITPNLEDIHVSGHPKRDELIQMYQWLRPRIAVPIHGEPMHLREHARLAKECQVPETVVPANGTLIRLAPGTPEIIDHVPVGRLARDGNRVIALNGDVLRTRNRMIHNGAAVATLVLDSEGRLAADPQIALLGIEDSDGREETEEAVAEKVRTAVENLARSRRIDDDTVRETARVTLRRALKAWHGKRPLTEVHLIRI